ncbi:MAG: hypothetical protein ACLP1W_04015, partial [Rhodomicrobium sp.]
ENAFGSSFLPSERCTVRFMRRFVTDPPTPRYAYSKGLGAPLTLFLKPGNFLHSLHEQRLQLFEAKPGNVGG